MSFDAFRENEIIAKIFSDLQYPMKNCKFINFHDYLLSRKAFKDIFETLKSRD